MDTLEQRVERLERSCRRWRLGFLILAAVAVAGAANAPNPPPDAQFGHLTVQSLTVRAAAGGPFIHASCDKDQASLKVSSPNSQTLIDLVAHNSADVLVSRNTNNGLSSASLSADQESGAVDLRDVTGKDKELQPE
jgi:hypothetical protein